MKKNCRIKKACMFVVVVALLVLPLASAIHTSIPVDHRVYRILDNAEIRGLLDRQSGARPYSAKRVLTLLEELQEQQDKLSSAEVHELSSLTQEIELSYGLIPSSINDVFSTGFFRTYDENTGIGASMGISLASMQTVSLVSKEYDSRNSVFAFLKGDVGENISFNMNFGFLIDKLDNRVFLPTDFTILGEGFYMLLGKGGRQNSSIPTEGFYSSLALSPEIGATFFDGAVFLRWGSIQRDWGPALNNIQLSGSARSIEGIELQIDLAPWLHFMVMTGSLGKFSATTLGGKPFFSDYFYDEKPYYRFENNFSAQRVEVNPTKNLTLSIFESVVWQKRFELGYLNPLSIYMFQQNNLGDIDNMLAGLDFNYTIADSVRIYGGLGTTELNKIGSLKTMLTAPRNMLAFQAGITVPLPIGSFSSLTFQWTYLAPFFYSHYPMMEMVGSIKLPSDTLSDSFVSKRGNIYKFESSEVKVTYKRDNDIPDPETIKLPDLNASSFSQDGRIRIEKRGDEYVIYETYSETAYVNKGENIGYPLNPNSQEFLLQLDLGFDHGWTTQGLVKYQVRSGQYGYSIEQYNDYLGYLSSQNYEPKDFWNNTFEHALTFELQVKKKLDKMPIELQAKSRYTVTWERDLKVDSTGRFDGLTTGYGIWKAPDADFVLQLGCKVFL